MGSLGSGRQFQEIQNRKPMYEGTSNQLMSSIESSDSFHLQHCHPAGSVHCEAIVDNPLQRKPGQPPVALAVAMSNRYGSNGSSSGSCFSDDENQSEGCKTEGQKQHGVGV